MAEGAIGVDIVYHALYEYGFAVDASHVKANWHEVGTPASRFANTIQGHSVNQ